MNIDVDKIRKLDEVMEVYDRADDLSPALFEAYTGIVLVMLPQLAVLARYAKQMLENDERKDPELRHERRIIEDLF